MRYVLIVLSDGYLKSPNCMYEILEFVKDDDYRQKVLPIVLDVSLLKSKLEYIEYWEQQTQDLKLKAARLDFKNAIAVAEDIKIHDNIASTIGEFLSFIQDMNCLSYDELKQSGFAPILQALKFDDMDITMRVLKMYYSEQKAKLKEQLIEIQKANPTNLIVKAILGELENSNGNYSEAICIYSDIIEISPDNAGAYNGRGYAYYMKGDYDNALPDLMNAIRLEPNYAAPQLNLGNIFFYTDSLDKALEHYSKAVTIEPDEAKNFYSRANCYRDLGNAELAIADYDEAIRLNPRFQNAFCNRGDLHRRLGKLDLAEKDFLVAINLDPTDDKPLYNLALIHMDRKEYTKAIAMFDRYL